MATIRSISQPLIEAATLPHQSGGTTPATRTPPRCVVRAPVQASSSTPSHGTPEPRKPVPGKPGIDRETVVKGVAHAGTALAGWLACSHFVPGLGPVFAVGVGAHALGSHLFTDPPGAVPTASISRRNLHRAMPFLPNVCDSDLLAAGVMYGLLGGLAVPAVGAASLGVLTSAITTNSLGVGQKHIDPEERAARALECYHAGDAKRAEEWLDSLREQPNIHAKEHLGHALNAMGRHREAASAFFRAARILATCNAEDFVDRGAIGYAREMQFSNLAREIEHMDGLGRAAQKASHGETQGDRKVEVTLDWPRDA